MNPANPPSPVPWLGFLMKLHVSFAAYLANNSALILGNKICAMGTINLETDSASYVGHQNPERTSSPCLEHYE
jgi:hypothetical protein